MAELDPVAVVQCSGCSWWWYFFDRSPTQPFFCTYCKNGEDPWEKPVRRITPLIGMARIRTPAYGTRKPSKKP